VENDGEKPGGLGGHSGPSGVRDTRLLERALREDWPIPEAIRRPLMVRLARIALDKSSSPRNAIAAARAILAASKNNLASIPIAIAAELHQETLDRISELEKKLDQSNGGEK
jgi:hypothetical protein